MRFESCGQAARVELVNQELRRDRPERSAIIASHRLSSVVNADHIIVLHEGRIVEAGTHEQLLERDGWTVRRVAQDEGTTR